MATLVDTAIATSNDIPAVNLREQYREKASAPMSNGKTAGGVSKLPHPSELKYKHVLAIHSKTRTSVLSSDAEKTPSYMGFRNIMVLMLIVSNARLMIENYRKYGVLICIRCHDYRRQDVIFGTILYFLVPCHLLVAYVIELAAAQRAKGAVARAKKSDGGDILAEIEKQSRNFRAAWRLIAFAHGINATLNLAIATTVVYYYINHPGIGTLCELHAVIVWLKVCSYAFTNRDLRAAMLSRASSPLPELYKSCPYPQNISVRNLCYFWWAPTLVYQPVYPRTPKIRWHVVFRHVVELIVLSIAIWIASAQYAAPLLQNSLDKISTLDFISIGERVMKLSTISLFCWLAGFYALFQSFLNLLAEITKFGDREFYTDWWNVSSIRTYWTTWNKPVYHFMKRHIYIPLVGRGWPPAAAQFVVFLFSGILHELLVGIPTHNIIGVAFLGMVGQIPLILMTDPLRKVESHGWRVFGNMVFWISFCLVGQPLAALLYFFAWQAKYGSASKPNFHMFEKKW